MQADYAAYEKANQVLEMPSGYSPQKQVFINSIWRYWVPVFGQQALGVVLALAALLLWWRLRRRRE